MGLLFVWEIIMFQRAHCGLWGRQFESPSLEAGSAALRGLVTDAEAAARQREEAAAAAREQAAHQAVGHHPYFIIAIFVAFAFAFVIAFPFYSVSFAR